MESSPTVREKSSWDRPPTTGPSSYARLGERAVSESCSPPPPCGWAGPAVVETAGGDGAVSPLDVAEEQVSDRTGDDGDTLAVEAQDGAADALQHRGLGSVAHGPVRVAHRLPVRGAGGRDAERRVTGAAGILHQQLQRGAHHLHGG